MEATQEQEWVALRQAAVETGLSDDILWHALKRGELKGQIRNRPTEGRPPMMLRRAEFDQWIQERRRSRRLTLPPHVRPVIVPLMLGARLVKRTPQALRKAVNAGKLKAIQVNPEQESIWYLRLGDLERWYNDTREGAHRRSVPLFDPEVFAQVEALALAPQDWDDEAPK